MSIYLLFLLPLQVLKGDNDGSDTIETIVNQSETDEALAQKEKLLVSIFYFKSISIQVSIEDDRSKIINKNILGPYS